MKLDAVTEGAFTVTLTPTSRNVMPSIQHKQCPSQPNLSCTSDGPTAEQSSFPSFADLHVHHSPTDPPASASLERQEEWMNESKRS